MCARTDDSCLGLCAPPGASQPMKMSSAAVQSTALPRHRDRGCTSGRVGISALRPMQLFFCGPAIEQGVSTLVSGGVMFACMLLCRGRRRCQCGPLNDPGLNYEHSAVISQSNNQSRHVTWCAC